MYAKLRLFAMLATLALLPLAPTTAGAGHPHPLQASKVSLPAGPGRIYLPFVVSPVIPPSSFDLIERARQAGTISDETAIVYRVYAAFGDPLLPPVYAGTWSENTLEADVAIREALAAWNELSPESQRALGPFFQPPIYIGSWFDRRHFPQPPAAASASPADEPGPYLGTRDGWHFVISGHNAVKVWWHESGAAWEAQVASATARVADEVWWEEAKLMHCVPLPDTGEHHFTDRQGIEQVWGDGGDDRFDIYLAGGFGGGGALASPYPPACTQTPSFIIMDPWHVWSGGGEHVRTDVLEYTVAHEFMHCLQFSYKYAEPCDDYLDSDEAGAVWAQDFVYPDNQHEHQQWYRFRDADDSLLGPESWGREDWVFPFYLSHAYTPDLIRTWWEQMEHAGPYQALDAALGVLTPQKKLQDVYHEFALNLWNRPPVDFYQQRDQVTQTGWGYPLRELAQNEASVDYTQLVDLGGQRSAQYVLPAKLDYLSTKYFHFVFTDSTARSVGFSNYLTIPFPDPDVKVRALVKVKGREWEVQDWSGDERKGFCRDIASERVEELVLVFSNSQWQDQTKTFEPFLLPTLTVSNVGCYQWRGTVTATHVDVDAPRTETHRGTLLFERLPDADGSWVSDSYQIKQGTVHVEMFGSSSVGCPLHMDPLDQSLDPEDGWLVVGPLSSGSLGDCGTFAGIAGPHGYRDITYYCSGGSYTKQEASQPSFRTDIMQRLLYVSADGTSIDETVRISRPGEGWDSVYTFHFDALAQP